MSLPLSRNTNYAAGSQVKSADLNAIQDEIIAAYTRVGGDREIWIDASGFRQASGASSAVFALNEATFGSRWTFVDPDTLASAISGIRQGERIKAIKLRGVSTGGTFYAKLFRRLSTANPTQIGSTLTHANTTTDQVHTLVSPETVDAGDQFFAIVATADGTADPVFYGFCLVVDRAV